MMDQRSGPIRKGPLPPVYFLCSLILELGLHFVIPVARIIPSPWHYIGVVLIVAGVSLAGAAAQQFGRADTPVKPSDKPTALVTGGLFRVTRNPMYLGVLLVLLGTAVILRTLTPLVVPFAFAYVITSRFIRVEEAFLREQFGEPYVSYCRAVRRWL
jgi:protein-S-isoprenylcysteine O-methyltransferase Ste14